MNKRQAKKAERKRNLLYDTSQKCYRDARKYRQWEKMISGQFREPHQEYPNYFGEF